MRAIALGGDDVSSRVLRGAVAVCAFGALVAAAVNRIELGALLIAAMMTAIAALVVVRAYQSLPSALRAQVVSARTMRARALWSFAVAVVISCAFWFGAWTPSATPLRTAIWRTLDFIPSFFSTLLPSQWQSGFHLYFRDLTYCFPGPFWWESMRYLRTAIPAYTIALFATASLVRLLAGYVRNRMQPDRGYEPR
jgi:hypothetical protein